jgi:hypothetical protein
MSGRVERWRWPSRKPAALGREWICKTERECESSGSGASVGGFEDGILVQCGGWGLSAVPPCGATITGVSQ